MDCRRVALADTPFFRFDPWFNFRATRILARDGFCVRSQVACCAFAIAHLVCVLDRNSGIGSIRLHGTHSDVLWVGRSTLA